MSNKLNAEDELEIATEMMTEAQYDEFLKRVEKAEGKEE